MSLLLELYDLNLEPFADAERSCRKVAEDIEDQANAFRNQVVAHLQEPSPSGTWYGEAAEAGQAPMRNLHGGMQRSAEQMDQVPPLLTRFLDVAGELKGKLRNEVDEARERGMEVDLSTGTVTSPAEALERYYEMGEPDPAVEYQRRIAELVAMFAEVDREIGEKIAEALAPEVDAEAVGASGTDADGESFAEAAASGAERGVDPHERLLEEYNAAPDPGGMAYFPPEWTDSFPGVSAVEMTATEASMLYELQVRQGLRGTYAAYDIYRDSLHQGGLVFGGAGETDGHADAFRHAYWNAQLTERFGADWAEEFATAHEGDPDNHPTPVAMDLHNNEVGRRIAAENPDADQEELRELVTRAVQNGETVVIDTDDRLQYSDQVEFGETRDTGPHNEWDPDNPQRQQHDDRVEPDARPDYY